MKSVSSTEAKARLNALLAEVQRTGASVTITSHGRPVAVLSPVNPVPRRFGQLPMLAVPDDFNAPLPDAEIAMWEGDGP
ncbi:MULTISPECIES: type II toxin-antitoxin system Phd/YefM family antitoxin [Mycobacterium]|jgi:prevent-host-death family protein|uniref:Antitoxin n=1 Tax=Mycobacterium gordonae TaxID=1778 RepID=A0A1A6BCR2_MYCGO|nr:MULTISPECIES: type II toxin-antitoxin system Phd/YefM family antitoxin [Mycobacterium]MBI2700016.1 type II toxin-antitoxin system Phd/YefM family antitoxin [Mycobacterium sp.]MBX9978310.1 type II toxin-antitoxin system Phd/YefM family antitoxin [Mycobacterium gordonae]MCQ4365522.1 type II toxin-antitoxin system Phd/YefM family antitoxin [Mycobacterium gordonae]MCV7008194.1 type II toxin-antitoxin system Phd/YefM family antitoxin [Mycobacterium gordonae]OBS00162.1 prevent-host-death protein 